MLILNAVGLQIRPSGSNNYYKPYPANGKWNYLYKRK